MLLSLLPLIIKMSYISYQHAPLPLLDDGKLKMEVTGTTMATGGEAKGQVTCKVIVGEEK